MRAKEAGSLREAPEQGLELLLLDPVVTVALLGRRTAALPAETPAACTQGLDNHEISRELLQGTEVLVLSLCCACT